jgi:hypothetical protein
LFLTGLEKEKIRGRLRKETRLISIGHFRHFLFSMLPIISQNRIVNFSSMFNVKSFLECKMKCEMKLFREWQECEKECYWLLKLKDRPQKMA